MRSLKSDASGIAAAVAGVLTTLVAILIGLMVYYKITGSLMSGARPAAVGLLYNNTNTTASTVFTLMPIVAIVMIASVILMVVMGFGRNTGQ